MTLRQTRTFRARLDERTEVSAFVESAVAGMPARLVMRLRLAVEELFVRTVADGHGGDCDAPVEVTVRIAGERIWLDYADTAPPFDPFAAAGAPDGAFLITELAERCQYARVGARNCVTAELRP